MDTSISLPGTQKRSEISKITLTAFVITTVLASANAVAVKFTVAELAPFWGAAVRFAAASLIFWAITLIKRIPLPSGRAFLGSLLYGLINFGLAYAFLYWGLRSIPASLAQIVLSLVPLLTILFAAFHRVESFHWRSLLGALLATLGITLAFLERSANNLPILALLALVAGAACIAEAIVVAKQYPKSHPIVTNALGMSAGTVTLLVISLIAHETWQVPKLLATWSSILYLVVFGSVAVFYLFLLIVQRWTASATSYTFVLMPFVTVGISTWLTDEKVSVAFLLGGLVVLAGIWVGAFFQPKARLAQLISGDGAISMIKSPKIAYGKDDC
jgi:drug/metabolite transporter (DMT)-like permease